MKKIVTTNRELRQFGLIFGVLVALLFGILLPWFFGKYFQLWPWCISIVTVSLAFLYPIGLKLLYDAWMLFSSFMGWINTRLILGVVFYLLFVPFGLVMKIFGKDPMLRKLDSCVETYRIKNKLHEKSDMEDPF